MKESIKKGFSFGLVSGIITTLGLLTGLISSTNSKTIVIGGIMIIAIADALSDSLGIHVSEEASMKSKRSVWESTFSTFLAKFISASSFLVPVILLPLNFALIVSIIWGLFLISFFSYIISKKKPKPYKPIIEHLIIAIFVIIVTYYLGTWVATLG